LEVSGNGGLKLCGGRGKAEDEVERGGVGEG